MTAKKTTKAELIAGLAAAGKGTEASLRRENVATLTAMLAEAQQPTSRPKKTKPTTEAALGRVASLLGLTLGETTAKRAYTRATATDADGQVYTLYRNATNVGIVLKGMRGEAARERLAELREVTGGSIRDTKAELLVPDEVAS